MRVTYIETNEPEGKYRYWSSQTDGTVFSHANSIREIRDKTIKQFRYELEIVPVILDADRPDIDKRGIIREQDFKKQSKNKP